MPRENEGKEEKEEKISSFNSELLEKARLLISHYPEKGLEVVVTLSSNPAEIELLQAHLIVEALIRDEDLFFIEDPLKWCVDRFLQQECKKPTTDEFTYNAMRNRLVRDLITVLQMQYEDSSPKFKDISSYLEEMIKIPKYSDQVSIIYTLIHKSSDGFYFASCLDYLRRTGILEDHYGSHYSNHWRIAYYEILEDNLDYNEKLLKIAAVFSEYIFAGDPVREHIPLWKNLAVKALTTILKIPKNEKKSEVADRVWPEELKGIVEYSEEIGEEPAPVNTISEVTLVKSANLLIKLAQSQWVTQTELSSIQFACRVMIMLHAYRDEVYSKYINSIEDACIENLLPRIKEYQSIQPELFLEMLNHFSEEEKEILQTYLNLAKQSEEYAEAVVKNAVALMGQFPNLFRPAKITHFKELLGKANAACISYGEVMQEIPTAQIDFGKR